MNRVLIVEDEMVIATDLKHRLERLGYEVIGMSRTGEEAVSTAIETCPDIILMDIQLVGAMDGIETIEFITRKCDSAVLFVTASSDPSTMDRLGLRSSDVIIKPFSDNELVSIIESVVMRRALNDQCRMVEEPLSRDLAASINNEPSPSDA